MSRKKALERTLFENAMKGKPLSAEEAIEYLSLKENWIQVHDNGKCYWAWNGINIPPYGQLQKIVENE